MFLAHFLLWLLPEPKMRRRHCRRPQQWQGYAGHAYTKCRILRELYDRPTHQRTNQLANHRTNQPPNQRTNQPTNQPTS